MGAGLEFALKVIITTHLFNNVMQKFESCASQFSQFETNFKTKYKV